MIFSSSPWLLSMNCSRHLKSTTTNAILIVVAVTPRKESVKGAFEDDADPEPVVDADFLSSLHAAITSAPASRTATTDRPRTMFPPTRVVCSTGAERLFGHYALALRAELKISFSLVARTGNLTELDALLLAARDVLDERGYGGLRVEDVLRE